MLHGQRLQKKVTLRLRIRLRKSPYEGRTTLLETGTATRDAVFLGDFVAFKHPSYLQPEKQTQTTY